MGAPYRVSGAGVGVRLTPRQSPDGTVQFLVVWPRHAVSLLTLSQGWVGVREAFVCN